MNAFLYGLDKTKCEFAANVAFDKGTNGQTDIKHELWKTLSSMSLLKIVGEIKAPTLAKIEFGNQKHTYSNICRKFAHCFCLVHIKKRTSCVF